MVLGLTQSLIEMSIRIISLEVGLITLPPSSADFLAIWKLQTPGTLKPCPGL